MGGDPRAIDIEIERNKVRKRCLKPYAVREEPDEMVYESRFQRLWVQFRREQGWSNYLVSSS